MTVRVVSADWPGHCIDSRQCVECVLALSLILPEQLVGVASAAW